MGDLSHPINSSSSSSSSFSSQAALSSVAYNVPPVARASSMSGNTGTRASRLLAAGAGLRSALRSARRRRHDDEIDHAPMNRDEEFHPARLERVARQSPGGVTAATIGMTNHSRRGDQLPTRRRSRRDRASYHISFTRTA